jgi:uroporphyrinogen decarboxylase
VEHLSLQVRAGAEVVQIFDSWAGVLPEVAFRRWSIEPIRAIAERLRTLHPDVPIIGFPRGAAVNYPAFAADAKVDAVGLDTVVPPAWAARMLPPTLPLQGNLDPVMLVVGGPALETEVTGILNAFAGRPFVFNLGHGILQYTPPDNVAHLTRVLREWRAAP